MTAPKPKQVYDNPDAYWDFVTVTTDVDFEGQYFDRKEAGRPEPDGTAHNAKLSGVRHQIEECAVSYTHLLPEARAMSLPAQGGRKSTERMPSSSIPDNTRRIVRSSRICALR